MQPIRVPKPPASAFNKNRRVSDLLQQQLAHFRHLDHKHALGIDPALERDIGTEAGAARYIAAITRALRGKSVRTGIALVPRAADTQLRTTDAPIADTLPSIAASAEQPPDPDSSPAPPPAVTETKS